jgi:hypothetical protein
MFDSKFFDFVADKRVWGAFFVAVLSVVLLLIAVIGIAVVVTRVVTNPEPEETPILVETITDWNMFGVTVSVGILSILSTVIAVWYTNKKTRDLYDETREVELQLSAMAVIKPSLKYAAFWEISEKLILDGNEERMLVLTSKEDGFGFFDDGGRWSDIHCVFSISNECNNRAEHIKISTNTKLTTMTDAEKSSSTENVVKLLREGERILFRVYSDEQQKIRENCIANKEVFKTEFLCTIDYLTTAEQQINYIYNVVITNSTKTDDKGNTTYVRKTEIIKDEYEPMKQATINKNAPASHFRDLQESLTSDGFGYKYRKIGDKQMMGTLDALHRFWKEQGMDTFVANAASSVNSMNESMNDVASAVNGQRKFFEEVLSRAVNQGNPPHLETKELDKMIDSDES